MGAFGNQAVNLDLANTESASPWLKMTTGWDTNVGFIQNAKNLVKNLDPRTLFAEGGMLEGIEEKTNVMPTAEDSQDFLAEKLKQQGKPSMTAADIHKYMYAGDFTDESEGGKNEMAQQFIQGIGGALGESGVDRKIHQGGATQTAWQKYLGEQIKEKAGEDNSTLEMRTPVATAAAPIQPAEVEGQQEVASTESRMDLMLKEYESDIKEQKQFARRRSILDAVNKAKPQGSRFSFRR